MNILTIDEIMARDDHRKDEFPRRMGIFQATAALYKLCPSARPDLPTFLPLGNVYIVSTKIRQKKSREA